MTASFQQLRWFSALYLVTLIRSRLRRASFTPSSGSLPDFSEYH